MGNFRRCFERGLSVIPVKYMGKNPIVKDWSKYCYELPTENQIDEWDSNNFNIGLACGQASNIIAIDIDKDSALSICPPSIVRRKGSKGEVRFFRYSDKIKSLKRHDLGIEIFSNGSQVLLPPSIHPDGMTYRWLTHDTLENTTSKELPEFPIDFFLWLSESQKGSEKTGRNNKLVSMITAAHNKGKDKETIATEIYEYDRLNHKPRLFTDPSEQYKARTEEQAKNAAYKMTASVISSIDKTDSVKIITEKEVEAVKSTSFHFRPYPKPRGMMLDFYEVCELRSAGKQDALALGGALSLMAVLASNRFVTECRGLKTCPNLYVINLGYSGFGKETSQSILNELLSEADLLGSGNYKSGTSIIMNLAQQQERLDIIDECSTILSAMGSKESYASQMVEILSELFTKGSSKYAGQTSVANGERFGAAYNPHISILGSTTPKGFRTSVNKEVAAKGLLPRMLLFFQHEVGAYKGRQDRSTLKQKMTNLKSMVDQFLKIEKKVDPMWTGDPVLDLSPKNPKAEYNEKPFGNKYKQTVIPFSHEAEELWYEFEEECHNKKSKDPESFESAFIARFAELTAKLALLDALSMDRRVIEKDSFLWAKEVIETQWYNAEPLFMEAHAESNLEAEIFKILNWIKFKGMLTKSDLKRKFQRVDERVYNQAINSLIETKQIQLSEVKQAGAGRPKIYLEVYKEPVN